VVAGSNDGCIHILEAAHAKLIATISLAGYVFTSVALDPDEKFAVVGTQNGFLIFIDLESNTETSVVPLPAGAVTALSFSRDGKYLAVGTRTRLFQIWKRTGPGYEQVLNLDTLPSGIRDLSFSPTDDCLMVVLDNERAVRVWDLEQLQKHLATFQMQW
jgi:WD40 repeat protein